MFEDSEIEHYLALAGVVVTVFSTAASLVNHAIRDRQTHGEAVPRWLIKAGAAMNLLSANFDKTLVLVRAARGKPLVSGSAVAAAGGQEAPLLVEPVEPPEPESIAAPEPAAEEPKSPVAKRFPAKKAGKANLKKR